MGNQTRNPLLGCSRICSYFPKRLFITIEPTYIRDVCVEELKHDGLRKMTPINKNLCDMCLNL